MSSKSLRQRLDSLLLGGLPRRLPWQDEPKTFHRVGLVPLLCYRLKLYGVGWTFDRAMPERVRGSFWEKLA